MNAKRKSPGKELEMHLDESTESLSSSKQEMNESNVMNEDDIVQGHLFGCELVISNMKGGHESTLPHSHLNKNKNKPKENKSITE